MKKNKKSSIYINIIAVIILIVVLIGIAVGLSYIRDIYLKKENPKIEDKLEYKLKRLKKGEELSVIVVLKEPLDLEKLKDMGIEVDRPYQTLPIFSFKGTKEQILKVVDINEVEKLYEDGETQTLLNESIPLISADEIWEEYGITGSGVKVCVVDSGIDYNNPVFRDKIIGQIDTANNDSNAFDDNGHGTAVAGTIASNDTLYKGVAPGVSLLIAKSQDEKGQGSDSSIISALDWCVSKGADVINLSLCTKRLYNSTCDDNPLSIASNFITSNYGIVVVAAAGNSGVEGMGAPGCASEVISVGATNKSGYVAWWSSEGSEVDILAPGDAIKMPVLKNKFMEASGTSFSAPHIAGAAALLKEATPDASVDIIKGVLYSSTKQVSGCYECSSHEGAKCNVMFEKTCSSNDTGYGVIDLKQSYLNLKSGNFKIPQKEKNKVEQVKPFKPLISCLDPSALDFIYGMGVGCRYHTILAVTEAVCSCIENSSEFKFLSNKDWWGRNSDKINTLLNFYLNCCSGAENMPVDDEKEENICWKEDYRYLYKDDQQIKKFCKCASGQYGYVDYNFYRQKENNVYEYLNSEDNEIWKVVSGPSNLPVYEVTCSDGNKYRTDKDYNNVESQSINEESDYNPCPDGFLYVCGLSPQCDSDFNSNMTSSEGCVQCQCVSK
ncbi:MAG: S8 family serine peptidase [Candidatus Pacebacteria bacterium]|nr:S8 family serine peptidase [Candidatus Paceibacterota bacterium]